MSVDMQSTFYFIRDVNRTKLVLFWKYRPVIGGVNNGRCLASVTSIDHAESL